MLRYVIFMPELSSAMNAIEWFSVPPHRVDFNIMTLSLFPPVYIVKMTNGILARAISIDSGYTRAYCREQIMDRKGARYTARLGS